MDKYGNGTIYLVAKKIKLYNEGQSLSYFPISQRYTLYPNSSILSEFGILNTLLLM